MTWRRVDPFFARRIQLAAFIIGIGFGIDYLLTPLGSSTALSYLERSYAPLWAWGLMIFAAGMAGFLVEWRVLADVHPFLPNDKRWRWGWITNLAHITLFAAFVVLTLSVLVDICHRGMAGQGWYGWRTPLMWGGYAYANFQFIKRLGDML